MDDHLVTFCCDEHDDLQEIGGAIRTNDQLPVGVFTDVVDCDGMLDGVEDVVITDAVAPGSRVDLHTPIL